MFLMKSLLKQAVLLHGSQKDEEKQPGLSPEFLTFSFPGHRYLYIYIILTFSYIICWLLFILFFYIESNYSFMQHIPSTFFFSKFFPVPLSLRFTHCSQAFLWTTTSQIIAWKMYSTYFCSSMLYHEAHNFYLSAWIFCFFCVFLVTHFFFSVSPLPWKSYLAINCSSFY